MRLQKKPVEATATNNYAETKSTEVKLRLKPAVFFVNYVKKTVRCGNFFLSVTVCKGYTYIGESFTVPEITTTPGIIQLGQNTTKRTTDT